MVAFSVITPRRRSSSVYCGRSFSGKRVGLLVIGLWNATLLLSEKGFYGLAYFLSLFGAVAVQKNVRDVWDPTRLREPLSVTEEGPET